MRGCARRPARRRARHRLYRSVRSPTPAKRLTDVLVERDKWEAFLAKYYRCGGEVVPDKTKIMVAMDVLPVNTDASVKLLVKGGIV